MKLALLIVTLYLFVSLSNGGDVIPIPTTCFNAFRNATIKIANTLRAFHLTPPLSVNSNLQASAQAYADLLATKVRKLLYNESGVVGECLFDKSTPETPTDDFCTSNFFILNFSII